MVRKVTRVTNQRGQPSDYPPLRIDLLTQPDGVEFVDSMLIVWIWGTITY